MTAGGPPPAGNCCGNPGVPGALSWMPFPLSFLVSGPVADLYLWWLSESTERDAVLSIIKLPKKLVQLTPKGATPSAAHLDSIKQLW